MAAVRLYNIMVLLEVLSYLGELIMKSKSKVSSYLYFQRIALLLWMIAMPIMLVRISPAAMVFASFKQVFSLGILFMIIWFVSSLFFGRMYCSLGCPLGAGQEIVAKLIPKRLKQKGRNARRYFRYALFAIWFGVIVMFLVKNGGFKEVDFLFTINAGETIITDNVAFIISLMPYFMMSIGVLLILTLLIGNRATCNYFCPMNVLGIIGSKIKNTLKYPSLNLKCDSKACVGCKRCSNSCQMSIEVHEMVRKGNVYDEDCILCGSCINACKKDAIYFTWNNKKTG